MDGYETSNIEKTAGRIASASTGFQKGERLAEWLGQITPLSFTVFENKLEIISCSGPSHQANVKTWQKP